TNGPCKVMKANKHNPNVTTDIHAGSDANDTAGAPAITAAAIGSTVHDKATVSGSNGTPTGTVTFTVFSGNTNCSANASVGSPVTLDGNGVAHPSADATVPVGGLSYRAHYNGNATYNEPDGPCETLNPNKPNPKDTTDVD